MLSEEQLVELWGDAIKNGTDSDSFMSGFVKQVYQAGAEAEREVISKHFQFCAERIRPSVERPMFLKAARIVREKRTI